MLLRVFYMGISDLFRVCEKMGHNKRKELILLLRK